MAIEIVSFLIKNGGSFQSFFFVNVYRRPEGINQEMHRNAISSGNQRWLARKSNHLWMRSCPLLRSIAGGCIKQQLKCLGSDSQRSKGCATLPTERTDSYPAGKSIVALSKICNIVMHFLHGLRHTSTNHNTLLVQPDTGNSTIAKCKSPAFMLKNPLPHMCTICNPYK